MTVPHLDRLGRNFGLVFNSENVDRRAAFLHWLEPYRVPLDRLPEFDERETQAGSYSTEGEDIFFRWWVVGNDVIGRPVLPNATDSGLPPERDVGYLIPSSALREMPKRAA